MSTKTAAALFAKYNALTTAPNIFRIADPGGAPDSRDKYPVQLGSTDKDDVKFAIRQDLVGGDGIVPGVGLATAGDEFFGYAQRKQEQEMLFDFQKYLMANAQASHGLDTPASAAWWFEKFPWMKEKRLELINQQAEAQKNLARINITGPQNEEDFMMLYLRQKGLLKVSDMPLHKLNEATDIVSSTFKQGFFNPLSQKKYQTMQTSRYPDWANPITLDTVPNASATNPNRQRFQKQMGATFGGGDAFYGGPNGMAVNGPGGWTQNFFSNLFRTNP